MEEPIDNFVAFKLLSGKKKKKLFSKINSQMEFYFSDSNLAKDKFLQNLIDQNSKGYVNLEVFKSFNKLKELTDDINIIAAAVSKSNILKVNEDKTKIRRTTPLGTSKDFDACTLYVEKLPFHADHNWIKDVFEPFGDVDHVNIPRFKVSKRMKGFAFVEFSNSESVIKACEHYKNLNAKTASESEEDSSKKDSEKEVSSLKESKKRKCEFSANNRQSKKMKDYQNSAESNEQEVKKQSEDEVNYTSANEVEPKSKHRKKKGDRPEGPRLRVMSKFEWKAFRNRYLSLQRSTMSHIKRHIFLEMQELREEDAGEKSSTPSEPPKKGVQFQPGIILKIALSKPIDNAAEIKEQVKASASVAYVDAQLGHSELFLRCHNPEEAEMILQSKKMNDLGSLRLLQGDEEQRYWKKIEEDRNLKFSISLKDKNRGRDKIIAKAAKLEEQRNKHTYFEE